MNNKKILVAGAAGLLGTKVVKQALLEGASVLAFDVSEEVLRVKLASEGIDLYNSKLEIVEADITDEVGLREIFKDGSKLSGAVNCTYPRNSEYGKHFFDVTYDSFNENLALHLGSAFLFMQLCAKYFKSNHENFSLVNISSIYGVVAPKFEIYNDTPMTVPVEYAAIKSATLHLSKYVTSYVNDSRFRINSVSPGGIVDAQPEIFLKAYAKNTLGKGMLEVDNIVGSILFLLSEKSEFVVGQNIIIDDGFTL
jgi:NAD(P)-dependent dehydrogenase (short-subunit alcohol dehydrogenase family)